MTDKVFIDTNILVYAHDETAPQKREISRELIFDCIRAGTAVISPQVLSEFFVTVTRKIKVPLPLATARKEIQLLSVIATVDLDATRVVRAIEISSIQQINYWDALILAAAERARCKQVYSEDLNASQAYGTLKVINPFMSI